MKRHAWAAAGVIGAIVIAGLVAGRAMAPHASRQSRSNPVRSRPVPVVGVAHPRQLDLPVTLSLTASIESLRQAVILPKVSGYLQQVTVRPGDAVRQGEVIAVVDHAQLDALVAQAQAAVLAAQAAVQAAQAQVAAAHAQSLNAIAVRQSAEAQLESARAGLVRAQAQLTDAQSTFARTQALTQQGAVSQQALDDAQAQVQTAKAGVDAAEAQIRVAQAQIAQAAAQVQAAQEQETAAAAQVRTQQAQVATQEAALESARLQLGYATIVAPFDGVVVNRTLGPGAYVTPGTSTPILMVADLDRLYVVVHIAEAELSTVHRGDAAQVRVDAYPTQVFRGIVSKIAGGVDPVTRTVQVEIDVPNPGHPLRPGMYATASLEAGSLPALAVPLSALVTVGSQHYVWAVTDDGKVTQRPVTVGRATGEVVEITRGLAEPDVIVVRGTDLVREGQPVQTAPISP